MILVITILLYWCNHFLCFFVVVALVEFSALIRCYGEVNSGEQSLEYELNLITHKLW